MEVLAELLPPSYSVKAEPSAKDSRRQQQEKKNSNKSKAQSSKSEVTIKLAPEIDRRTGEDRRQKRINRGRWLESRGRSDRRASESTIFVRV